jgi:hypothetical protein
MDKTHWKSLADSSQYLGKQHFGPNEKKTVTIDRLEEETVENAKKRTREVKRVLHFKESDVRPLILNATNGGRIEKLLGTPYKEDWKGRKIMLYVDPRVPNNFDPDNPGAVRVWETLPTVIEAICEDCGEEIQPTEGYSVNKIITKSQALFGKDLCMKCAKKRKAAEEIEAAQP